MSSLRNTRKLPDVRRGDKITARYLSSVSRAINSNTKALAGPKQQNALEESNNGGAGLLDLDFLETGRTSTTVEITDDNGDVSQVEQMDTISLVNGAGQTLTFTFTNP